LFTLLKHFSNFSPGKVVTLFRLKLFHLSMPPKLIILDTDGTLWSHKDISSTRPPFIRINDETLVDSANNFVRLDPCARRLLESAKKKGVLLAIASWNNPDIALQALRVLGLDGFFDFPVVEPHPGKDKMVEKILAELGVDAEDAVFVDDTEYMVELVRARFPRMSVYRVGGDICDLCELIERLGLSDA
jgi:magnesium-dependent phosphatase 1